ncbi:TPA: hypothetical protein ACH3X1_002831 [Trebouxia sp. C0004]
MMTQRTATGMLHLARVMTNLMMQMQMTQRTQLGQTAHQRSKDGKLSVQHTSVTTRKRLQKHALYTSLLQADCEQSLTQLALFAWPSLDFNAIRIGRDYVVQRGKWYDQAAVWNGGMESGRFP